MMRVALLASSLAIGACAAAQTPPPAASAPESGGERWPLAGGDEPRPPRSRRRGADRPDARADDARAEGRPGRPARHRQHHSRGISPLPLRLGARRRQQRAGRPRECAGAGMAGAGRRLLGRVDERSRRRAADSGDVGHRRGPRPRQYRRRDHLPAEYRPRRDPQSRPHPPDRRGDRDRDVGDRHRLGFLADPRRRPRRPLGAHL